MNLPPIVIDTREKKNYNFYGHEVVFRKLDTGDYSIQGYEDLFAVERKSLPDYLQSISHERERFEREIQRGTDMAFFEVVIEASEEEVRNGEYYANVPPLSAINTAKAWSRSDRYNIPFTWAGGRREAKALVLSRLEDWHSKLR